MARLHLHGGRIGPLALLLPLFACAAPAPAPTRMAAPAAPPDPPPVASPAAPAEEAETSVRPGANDQYLQSDGALEWVARFEGNGREIFDRRQAILAATGVAPGSIVADVGAGTGLFARLFARAVGPQGRVYAVDIVPKFLAHIERESRRQGIGNITAVRGTDRSVSLPPASVDLLFLCDSYHHFEYPRSMNASLLAALRPGGTLVLIDFKRIPGRTSPGILEHVRAGQEVFTAELEAAGFEKIGEVSLLEENYLVRFRKAGAPAPQKSSSTTPSRSCGETWSRA